MVHSSSVWLVVALVTLGACSDPSDSPTDAGTTGTCPDDLPSACPAGAPSYSADIAPIVEIRCGACHAPGKPQASKTLVDYADLHALRGPVLNQVYACKMPPADQPQPTPDERRALLAWLVCGAPND